jgi:hypothetical protein
MGIIFPQRCGLLGRAGAALARLPWNKGAKSEEEKSVWTLLELQPSDEGNWRGFSQTTKRLMSAKYSV